MTPPRTLDQLGVMQTYLAEKAKKEHGAYVRTAIYGCSDQRVRQIVKAYQKPKLDNDLQYQPAAGEGEYHRRCIEEARVASDNPLPAALLTSTPPSETPNGGENANAPFEASESPVSLYLASSAWDVWQTTEREYEYTFPLYFDKWHPYIPGFDRDFWPTLGMSWTILVMVSLFIFAVWKTFHNLLFIAVLLIVCLPLLVVLSQLTSRGLDTLLAVWRLWLLAGMLLAVTLLWVWWGRHKLA